jgi:branched-chain amino acid transport system ATP-binding protein
MTTMTDLFSARALSVRYGIARAVENVDLTVPENGVVALLGANGAGKSSILKAIAGLIPAEGQMSFAGEDLARLTARARVRRGIVYVPEGRQIVGSLTVAENLLLGGFFLDARTLRRRRETMLELFPEIAGRLHSPAWMLSGGEQQMLAIGRGLMSAPRLLLLDEPSLGLAPLLIRRVFERLVRIKQETGLAIILVEQNFRMTMKVADAMYFVRNGSIVGHRTAADLNTAASRAEVVEAYLGAGQPIAV